MKTFVLDGKISIKVVDWDSDDCIAPSFSVTYLEHAWLHMNLVTHLEATVRANVIHHSQFIDCFVDVAYHLTNHYIIDGN